MVRSSVKLSMRAVLSALTIVGLFLGGCTSKDVSDGAGAKPHSTPINNQERIRCDPPPFRPTYLPWLRSTESVPFPDKTRVGRNGTSLSWYATGRPGWQADPPEITSDSFVALERTLRPRFRVSKDHRPDYPIVEVRGTKARLTWVGDPGVGGLAVFWSEGASTCDSFALHFLAQNLAEKDAEREAKKIARSIPNP